MFTLDVEHANSTDALRILSPDDLGDEETPSLQSTRIERKLTRQPEETDTAEVVVYRDAWSEVEQELDRTNDRLVIREDGDIVFGGRLADYQRDGVVVSVLIDSPKRDAIDAEPSGANTVLGPQPDSGIVTDQLLTRVPTVNAGTVGTVDNSIAFSESHASPGKSLTKLARDADAEARYRTTESAFKLDYVARLGTDRTDETLSPASATVLGEPRVREQVTEDVTHVRVLGAGEGTAQVEAQAVADSYDPADDRAVYRQRTDKDIQQSARAQSLAETLVSEYDGAPEYVEIEFEVPRSVNPSLGDSFAVALPAHDINKTLRITMLERLIDGAGDRLRAILSNRRHTGDTTGDARALELDSLSEGNAGQIVRDSDNSGWDTVSADSDVEFTFRPTENIIGELESKLYIESRPYRAYSSGAASGGSSTSGFNSEFDTVSAATTTQFFIDIDSSQWQEVASITPTSSTSAVKGLTQLHDVDGNTVTALIRLRNKNTGYTFPFSPLDSGRTYLIDGSNSYDSAFFGVDMSDCAGEEVVMEVKGNTSLDDGESLFYQSQMWAEGLHTHETPDHTHPADPGLTEFSDIQPTNVAISVDDTQVASGLSPPIDDVIDVEGLLTGDSHTIRATSDSLGHLRLSVTQETIKNAGD